MKVLNFGSLNYDHVYEMADREKRRDKICHLRHHAFRLTTEVNHVHGPIPQDCH